MGKKTFSHRKRILECAAKVDARTLRDMLQAVPNFGSFYQQKDVCCRLPSKPAKFGYPFYLPDGNGSMVDPVYKVLSTMPPFLFSLVARLPAKSRFQNKFLAG